MSHADHFHIKLFCVTYIYRKLYQYNIIHQN